ncbi:hypothetical protein ACFU99_16740 [Streptomyces sp. NPDC057654]|uniref:hypothetical protein n=1 Tax=Streptomyces sp. NPDC057654 TaxID=3346196 RepID=UPI00368696D6
MRDMNADSGERAGRLAGRGRMPPAVLAASLHAAPLSAAELVMISQESHDAVMPGARYRTARTRALARMKARRATRKGAA